MENSKMRHQTSNAPSPINTQYIRQLFGHFWFEVFKYLFFNHKFVYLIFLVYIFHLLYDLQFLLLSQDLYAGIYEGLVSFLSHQEVTANTSTPPGTETMTTDVLTSMSEGPLDALSALAQFIPEEGGEIDFNFTKSEFKSSKHEVQYVSISISGGIYSFTAKIDRLDAMKTVSID